MSRIRCQQIRDLDSYILSVTGGGTQGGKILTQKLQIQSDTDGRIDIPIVDGYIFFSIIDTTSKMPIHIIEVRDGYYVGRFEGKKSSDSPTQNSRFEMYFVPHSNRQVTLYYILEI